MFSDYLYKKTEAEYANKILLVFNKDLDDKDDYLRAFIEHGFEIIEYNNDLDFRIHYGNEFKDESTRMVIIATDGVYIPYDILSNVKCCEISYHRLFPKLNSEVLLMKDNVDLDLLSIAYEKNYDDLSNHKATEHFISDNVSSKENIEFYVNRIMNDTLKKAGKDTTYQEWLEIATCKAKADVLAAENRIEANTSSVNDAFSEFVLGKYGSLSGNMSTDTPLLVSRAMEYMSDHSDKFMIIVMDGMSEFDWNIISRSFYGMRYDHKSIYAMIPTTTSISRQCLLSNKYPSQLQTPWKQSNEKKEFVECAKRLGYKDNQIEYGRGYDIEPGPFVKCGAVIINDIDDMVHAQQLGRLGMYDDISLLSKQGKLAKLVHRLLRKGYDVYISADHGNTHCTGIGRPQGFGVEVETRSHRMMVLKEFADSENYREKYGLIEYPKYYLPKEYEYLVCNTGTSLDINGADVMSHGGITIDEVVVPFIELKAEENNG